MVDRSTFTNYAGGIRTALVALAAGVAGMLGSYAITGFTPAFVVAPVDKFLTTTMPSVAIRFAITVLGSLGQKLNLVFAGTLVVGALAVSVALALFVARRYDADGLAIPVSILLVWAVATGLAGAPLSGLGAAMAAGFVVAAFTLERSFERLVGVTDPDARRQVVTALGAAAGAGLVGADLGKRRATPTEEAMADEGDTTYGDVGIPEFDVEGPLSTTPDASSAGGDDPETVTASSLLERADANSLGIDGMDPLVSENFYEVDINSVNPNVDASRWDLSITGAVGRELTFSYADLAEMEFEHRYSTLRCVGESLNGHKTDTAVWTGVPIAPLLERAVPNSGCGCVMVRAADGYFEEFPLEALRPGMLVLGMNGKRLPRGHGAPVRVLTPGHWGEVNVKWVTEIELLNEEAKGYWEQRGWHGTGPVKTVAKLHAVNGRDDGRIEVGGHAYAGTRGISAVEVSVDGGDSWQETTLSDPLPGDDVWRQWRHVYDPPDGKHDVVVRAREADGTLQPSEETGSFPNGPSGWVEQTINPGNVL
jgi:DMSO/TMAO reductase YedYZ molybdopterin-dependent catalytic subunit